PSDSEIAAALDHVGMRHVTLDEERHTVRFARHGIELNLGSVGKGFALGRIAAGLRRGGLRHALLSAGGSSGYALRGPGQGVPIAGRPGRATRGPLAHLLLRDGGLGTSGAGEQFLEVQGRRYGHILDPRTGWPAAGVLSASVACADPAAADALSTAFF